MRRSMRRSTIAFTICSLIPLTLLGQQQRRGGRGASRPASPGMTMDYRPFYSSSLTVTPPRPGARCRWRCWCAEA